jgi:hypothetical protein
MQVNAGRWLATTGNRLIDKKIDMTTLDIDKEYYLQAIYKEIMGIQPEVSRHYKQLDIFLKS